MEMTQIEEELKKVIASLDKGARLEAVIDEEDEFRVILSKGTHSDRGEIAKGLMEEFLATGKGGHELKKILGKVISRMSSPAREKR